MLVEQSPFAACSLLLALLFEWHKEKLIVGNGEHMLHMQHCVTSCTWVLKVLMLWTSQCKQLVARVALVSMYSFG